MAKEEPDRAGMVEHELTDEELKLKGEQLAKLCQNREKLAEKKRTHNRKWNEELIQFDFAKDAAANANGAGKGRRGRKPRGGADANAE